jgi:hypothetical protein
MPEGPEKDPDMPLTPDRDNLPYKPSGGGAKAI